MSSHHAFSDCILYGMKFWNMPKIPRDISGRKLVLLLAKMGYLVVRQAGSHIRLECIIADKAHRLTIPDHDSMKIGTLSGILTDIAEFHGIEKAEVARIIFS